MAKPQSREAEPHDFIGPIQILRVLAFCRVLHPLPILQGVRI